MNIVIVSVLLSIAVVILVPIGFIFGGLWGGLLAVFILVLILAGLYVAEESVKAAILREQGVKNEMEQQWNTRLCPKCGGALYRVPPRFVDRLFSPGRYRFQCESQECYWIGNLPIEGTNSTRFGHGLIAVSIVVIVASVALGLFTIHRERAEVAATHNQSPSTTPSVMVVDDPQKAEEAFSVGVGHIGRLDVLTGALKGTNPADAAQQLPAHSVGAMAGVLLQPKEAISEELLACIKAVKSDPAAGRYYQKQGIHSKHLEDQSKATPEEVQALTLVFDRTKKCYATQMAAAQKTGGADLATAYSYEAFYAEMMVEAARLAKGEITWGVYNERCLERGTKSWEELKTRLAAIQGETKQSKISDN